LNLISSGVLDMSCAMEMERKFCSVCNVATLRLLDERCLLPQATLGVGQWRVSVNTHMPSVQKTISENDFDLHCLAFT
jgi:hypothetical protein